MRDLHASVSGVTHQPVADVYAFLADFNGYPSWYPSGVKSAQMTGEGTGHAVLALNQGPIQRDFEMDMAIEKTPESAIVLRRLPENADDKQRLAVTWLLAPDVGDAGTNITAEFAATLAIPGFLPLGGLERAIPQGFLDAALARLNG